MKRLYAVLSVIAVLAMLAVPAIAHAGRDSGFTTAGWTWDES
jgi:Tfp pilus assembly protein FimT